MKAIIKTCAALAVSLGMALFAQNAAAEHRPDSCSLDHDHRSHDANYYDYYQADDYYRAGDYRPGRQHFRDRRHRYGSRSEVVFRRDIDLRRYSAYVTVVEENYWTRSGRVQRVCSIVPKGRDAYHVPHRALSRIAHDNCSRRARIQYL